MHENSDLLKNIIKEETQREVGLFLVEERFKELKEQGLTREQANIILIKEFGVDDALNWLKKMWGTKGGLAGAAKESVIEAILEYLIGALGLNPRGWLAGVLTKAIANMTMDDWEAVMDGDCNRVVTVIEEALTEEILDRLIRRLSSRLTRALTKSLGIRPDKIDDLLGRSLRRVVRNMLARYLVETKMLSGLIEQAADYICSIDIGEIVSAART